MSWTLAALFFCARWRVVLRCTFRLLFGTEDTFRICILHVLVTRFREYLLLVLDHGVFDRPGGDKLPVLVDASDWRSGARGARGMPFSCAASPIHPFVSECWVCAACGPVDVVLLRVLVDDSPGSVYQSPVLGTLPIFPQRSSVHAHHDYCPDSRARQSGPHDIRNLLGVRGCFRSSVT